jgi:hypothetical protein
LSGWIHDQSLNVFNDRVAMSGPARSVEEKKIERASQQFNMGPQPASHCVGILLSFV